MNTETPSHPQFTADTTLGAIVAARPGLARIFEKLGLDYCCGGKRTLAAACEAKQLEPHIVHAMLEAAVAASAATPADVSVVGFTLTQLADHIEETHHAYLKTELPRLVQMAERVARKHDWRDARLPLVYERVVALAEEMMSHMQKEEVVLFPIVRELESDAADGGFHCGSIANPIRVMEAEHESAGAVTAELRELTDGFTPGPDACNTHRALLAGLAEFEADLHRHVHKENNVLFPRALALAGRN